MEQRADDTEPVIRRRLEIYTASVSAPPPTHNHPPLCCRLRTPLPHRRAQGSTDSAAAAGGHRGRLQGGPDRDGVLQRTSLPFAVQARPVEDFYARSGKLLDFEITGGIPQTLPRLLDVLKPQLEPAAPTA